MIETALAKEEDWGRRVFVRYWCLCESYVKALGLGFPAVSPPELDIAEDRKGTTTTSAKTSHSLNRIRKRWLLST